MAKFKTFGKIMAWLVMFGGMAISIVLAVNFFITASQYGSSSIYSSAVASSVWYGIGSILVGFVFSIGSFVIINMITEMYVNSCIMRSKFCGDYYAPHPMQSPAQYAAPAQPVQNIQPAQPVQQPAFWYCTNCSAQNSASSSFCTNCGQQRK
ncbi:MAG: zinc-ribbon domain-containing protein [Oscillospiraceae bacterium]